MSVVDTTDPGIATLTEQAKQAIEAGRYDEADTLLLRAREQDVAAAQQAREAAKHRLLRAAESEEKRGDLSMTRLRYSDAAEHYAAAVGFVQAGSLAAPSRRVASRRYIAKQAKALWRDGKIKALFKAEALYGDLLAKSDPEDDPSFPSRTWLDRGRVLFLLAGMVEDPLLTLEAAQDAFRRAKEEATDESAADVIGQSNSMLHSAALASIKWQIILARPTWDNFWRDNF